MLDITGLQGPRESVQATLHEAQRARLEAELAGCEMEELAAVLHKKPPVGRWPHLTRASHGPRLSVFSD